MNDHAILETLRTGDVLNVSTTNPANGEVDVLFSVVLREEIGPNGTRLLYLSRLEHERPMAVPIRQNPVADMNNRIIQNGDVRTPTEITSLVLDQIGMPHGERELALLSAAIVQMVKMFGNPKIELVMPIVSVPVHTEQPPAPPSNVPPTTTVH